MYRQMPPVQLKAQASDWYTRGQFQASLEHKVRAHMPDDESGYLFNIAKKELEY